MKIVFLFVVMILPGCGLLKDISYHPTAPGYLSVDKNLRNKTKHVSLVPASLFDEDDSLSMLRLGFFWQPEMGNKVDYIVSIPTGWSVKEESLISNIQKLELLIDDSTVSLQPTKNPVRIKSITVYGKKNYTLEYAYVGDKKTIAKMVKAKNVRVKLNSAGKVYSGRFDVNSNYRLRFMRNRNYAYNAAGRFIKIVNE